MSGFVNSLYSGGGTPLVVVGLIMVLLGLLEAFLGYRIFKIQVAIVAFLAGFFIGLGAMNAAFGVVWLSLAVGVVLGAVFIWLSVKFFKVGLFLLGAFFGFVLGLGIVRNIWFGLLVAIVVGILAVVLTRPVVILATAFGGASLVAGGIGTIFWGTPQAEPIWLHWIILAVVGVFGAIVQFRTTREHSIHEELAPVETTPGKVIHRAAAPDITHQNK